MHGFGFGIGYGEGYMGILILILIVVVVVFVIKGVGSSHNKGNYYLKDMDNMKSSNNSSEKALEVLKERYAKGEITKERFEKMKRDIVED